MRLPNQIEKAFLLKKTFLFADLNLEHLFAIADKIEIQVLDKGECVFKDNQNALHLYIIEKGQVQLFDKKNQLLIELSEGDLFGDEALFNDQLHQYQAICSSSCHLLTLTKKHITAIISECPSVAINLLEAFARQITFRHAAS
ncbi:MAG: hypothetical protein S4CHLAM6_01660 [Chlamydiae bacterium]|nr:hypothetical protein [Chlamydiota bacterium]